MSTKNQMRKRKLMTETEKDPDWLSGEKQMKIKNYRSRRRIMQDRSCKKNTLSINPETPSQSSSRISGIQGNLLLASKEINKGPSAMLGEKIRNKEILVVTCGDKGGTLHKEKFNNSEPCIFLQDSEQWFTPQEFEKFGGKGKNKKWKISIFYRDLSLQTLIEGGFLSSPSFKQKVQDEESSPVDRVSLKQTQCKRVLFPSSGNSSRATNQQTAEITSLSESSSDNSSDDDDGDDEVDADMTQFQDQHTAEIISLSESSSDKSSDDDDGDDEVNAVMTQFQGPSAMLGQNIRNEENLVVTCGDKEGVLHKERYNNSEPCIFLQDSEQWFTPPEFEKFGGKGKEKQWKNSILYHNRPLQTLIEGGFLSSPSFKQKKVQDEEQNQKNNGVCFFCNSGGLLVCSDNCPQASHHRGHSLPLKDNVLSIKMSSTQQAKLNQDGDPTNQPDDPPCGSANSQLSLSGLTELMDPVKMEICEKADSVAATMRSELASVHKELLSSISSVCATIDSHSKRLKELENSAVFCSGSLKEMSSEVSKLAAQVTTLQAKCENLESRSRQNNIRLVGIPEGLEGSQPTDFVAQLLQEILGLDEKLVVDRAHRSLRARPKPGERPRPLIARLHYYKDKVHILRQANARGPLLYGEKRVFIFPDFTAAISKKRAEFAGVRRMLQGNSAFKAYSFLHSGQMRITLANGEQHRFDDPSKAAAFVNHYLLTSPSRHNDSTPGPSKSG